MFLTSTRILQAGAIQAGSTDLIGSGTGLIIRKNQKGLLETTREAFPSDLVRNLKKEKKTTKTMKSK